MVEVPAIANSGGMVLLWNNEVVKVSNFTRNGQSIHVMIEVKPKNLTWLFSTIYASNDLAYRHLLWDNIKLIFDKYKGPWLVTEDFNEIINSTNKFGGRPINQKRARTLIDCRSSCNLVDLGYKGCKYTWSNHRMRNGGLIMERLDRVYSKSDWLQEFNNVTVTHLPKIYSDHNPILVNLNNSTNNTYARPFRLETFWCSHSDFPRIVKESWENRGIIKGTEQFQNSIL